VGWRFLRRALSANGAQRGMFLWVVLFCVVSFQVTTFLRPVLWHPQGSPLFRTGEKMSFFEHLDKVLDEDEQRDEARRKAEEKELEKKKPEERKAVGQATRTTPR
jgi:hypothetical protein